MKIALINHQYETNVLNLVLSNYFIIMYTAGTPFFQKYVNPAVHTLDTEATKEPDIFGLPNKNP